MIAKSLNQCLKRLDKGADIAAMHFMQVFTQELRKHRLSEGIGIQEVFWQELLSEIDKDY